MKTIIAGGRDYKLTDEGRRMLDILRPTITEVVSGKARGADSEGERWANENDKIDRIKNFIEHWGYDANQEIDLSSISENIISCFNLPTIYFGEKKLPPKRGEEEPPPHCRSTPTTSSY